MEYIVDIDSLEYKAALLANLVIKQVGGGGINHCFSDCGSLKLRREYKSILKSLKEAQQDNPFNRSL